MDQNAKQIYETHSVGKLILKFSIPSIISMLIASLYNMVDQVFIGHGIGYLGNGATNVVYPITVIALALALLMGNGCAAFLSITQGQNDQESGNKAVGNLVSVCILVSIVVMAIFMIFKEPILWGFGATENNIDYAREYYKYIVIGIPLYMFGNAINAVIRADGSPKFAMMATVVGAVANLILDPVAIFVLNWGMMGAAVATVIGQALTALMSVWYLTRTKTVKLHISSFRINWNISKRSFSLGISSFITQISLVLVMAAMNNVLVRYGAMSKFGADIPLTVIGIVMKVFSIVTAFCVGLALGIQPIVGYNYGARKYDKVRSLFKRMLLIETAIGVVAFILFQTIPMQIISIFGNGDALYQEFAVNTMRIYLCGIIFCCIQKGCCLFLLSLGKPVTSSGMSLVREIILHIPLILLLPKAFGILGVLLSAPIADVVSCGVTLFVIIQTLKKSGILSKENKLEETVAKETVLQPSKKGVIIAISREHGSSGKEIGKVVAKRLNIPFYYKEVAALAAEESGLHKSFISDINQNSSELLSELYLSTEVVQQAVIAQEQIIRKIADQGACVIVGRAADYVLREYEDVVRIFIYAPKECRINRVMKIYGDSRQEAEKNIHHSDHARAAYYHSISGQVWGDSHNYDLLVNSDVGVETSADVICDYINRIPLSAKKAIVACIV